MFLAIVTKTQRIMTEKIFIEELLNSHTYMLRFANKLTGNYDDSLDLMQETMLRAYSKRFSFIEGTNFTFWLLTIMRNIHLNRIAYEKRRPVLVIPDYQNYNFPDSFDESYLINVSYITHAIDRLPLNFAVPFKLFLSGYHYDEIAAELHLPISTVKNRIHSARIQLRSMLSEFLEQ